MSNSGAIQQQIGPLKTFVSKHQQEAKEALQHIKDSEPEDITSLRRAIQVLNRCYERLQSSNSKLSEKNDEWAALLKTAPDDQAAYDSACAEIMNLLLESDELFTDISTDVNDLQAELDNLAESASQDDTKQSPGQADSTPQSHPNPQSGSSGPPPPTHNGGSGAFKAPKFRLPTFSGDYMQFKQFWSIFEANIHNRTDFRPIEKFTYLLSQLEGDAKKVLNGVSVSDDNYDVAVALLRSRFDRADDRLTTMLYSEFMRIPACSGRLADKQRTLDDCESVFRQLETAGEDINSNKSLVFGLLSKFPGGMVKDLQRHYSVGPNNALLEVRTGLQKSLIEEEMTAGMLSDMQSAKQSKDGARGGQQPQQKNYEQPGSNHDRSVMHTSALPAMQWRGQRSKGKPPGGAQLLGPPKACYFCGDGHFNGDCQQYPTAECRRHRLKELNRCVRCLFFHYKGNPKCPFAIKCVHCRTDEDHASALCDKTFPSRGPCPPVGSMSLPTAAVQQPQAPLPMSQQQQNDDSTAATANSSSASAPDNVLQNTGSGGVTALNYDAKPALFQTAKTTVVNPVTGQSCTARIALDTLSSRHYIRSPVAQRLGLTGDPAQKLFVSVFGTTKTLEVPTERVEFDVTFRDGSKFRVEANTTKVICSASAMPNEWTADEKKALDHFLPALADDPYDDNGTIDILIGASLVWEFVEGKRMPTTAGNVFLIPSKFGLLLSGESQHVNDDHKPTMLCITDSPCSYPSEIGLVSCETKLTASYPDIDEFWALEKIGITDSPVENDDDVALQKFQDTVQYENGRYQVALPWIEEKKHLLPTNYDVAYDRLRSLAKRLRSNDELLQSYRDIFALQQERGFIEEVPPSEVATENQTHYLPHHAVQKPSSATTKVRIVFDAAARKTRHSLSLNQCLLRGPVILPDLCQLLMRMRVNPIVVISDIEKAFLQVSLQPQERDVTRFLWFKDDTNLTLKDNIKAFRYARVNFGVICSPFLLAATINHHLTTENSTFAESLRNDIYVDNVITGLDTTQDPVQYYHELKDLFARAGMNMFEFCSNSDQLMQAIPETDRVKQTDARVLGMKWDSQGDDTLRLVPSPKLDGYSSASTKRKVLQAVASVFDPMGFFQPVLLPAKILLNKLWKLKYDWDDPLTGNLLEEWKILADCLMALHSHRIPRFIGQIDGNCTLAVFCDASKRAYATAVYLRCRVGSDSWISKLLFAKSRLSPSVKKGKGSNDGQDVKLPRLELLGALIGARAAKFCREGLSFPNTKIDLFTDSQCVLRWLGSRGLLKRFVANRIDEIRKLDHCQFHYVNTKENPADFSTRGKLPDELFSSELWWNGPTWLTRDQSQWPKTDMPELTNQTLEQIQQELRPAFMTQTLLAADPVVQPPPRFLSIDPTNYSSLQKLLRVSALCLKFLKRKVWSRLSPELQNSKSDLQALFDDVSTNPEVTADDYNVAKLQWLKTVQRSHFDDILKSIGGQQVAKRPPQVVAQLGLRMDPQGLIRTAGRFENADLPDAARVPILLPKDSPLTLLIVKDFHDRNMHSGVSHTLCQIRQEFWIPHGRSLVRRVASKCLICRRYKIAPPFKLPPFPPLPKDRVSRSAPFQATGLDYFGPITVKVNDSRTKMWVCLFTCLSTRAIHLEPVMDCSAHEFLCCLIRFTSRRGVPESITSDNAAQFQLVKILGDEAWKRIPSDPEITSYAASSGVRWKFITELAPWQGGFYERLVGLVKSTLRSSIRQKLLSWTDLVTLTAEAEAVVNSRPLTYLDDDVNSLFRALRPCDFLIGRPTAMTDSPDGAEVSAKTFGDAGKRLVSIWKQRCRLLDKLWTYWYDDYLLSLRERRKVSHKAGRSDVDKTPLLHQVVLVVESDAPRGRWKLARITSLLPGSDGRIRAAEIVLSNGTKLRRALNHLVPLEVETELPSEPEDNDAAIPDTDVLPDNDNDRSDLANESSPEPEVLPDTESDSREAENESSPEPEVLPDTESDSREAENDSFPEPAAESESGTDYDYDFSGFSDDDIQRTIDALQRLDGPPPNGTAPSRH